MSLSVPTPGSPRPVDTQVQTVAATAPSADLAATVSSVKAVKAQVKDPLQAFRGSVSAKNTFKAITDVTKGVTPAKQALNGLSDEQKQQVLNFFDQAIALRKGDGDFQALQESFDAMDFDAAAKQKVWSGAKSIIKSTIENPDRNKIDPITNKLKFPITERETALLAFLEAAPQKAQSPVKQEVVENKDAGSSAAAPTATVKELSAPPAAVVPQDAERTATEAEVVTVTGERAVESNTDAQATPPAVKQGMSTRTKLALGATVLLTAAGTTLYVYNRFFSGTQAVEQPVFGPEFDPIAAMQAYQASQEQNTVQTAVPPGFYDVAAKAGQAALKNTLNAGTSFVEQAQEFVQPVINAAYSAKDQVLEAAAPYATQAKEIVQPAIDAAYSAPGKVVEFATPYVNQAAESASAAKDQVVQTATSYLSQAYDAVVAGKDKYIAAAYSGDPVQQAAVVAGTAVATPVAYKLVKGTAKVAYATTVLAARATVGTVKLATRATVGTVKFAGRTALGTVKLAGRATLGTIMLPYTVPKGLWNGARYVVGGCCARTSAVARRLFGKKTMAVQAAAAGGPGALKAAPAVPAPGPAAAPAFAMPLLKPPGISKGNWGKLSADQQAAFRALDSDPARQAFIAANCK